MFILVKNAKIYAPEEIKETSVLIAGGKIVWLGGDFPAEKTLPDLKVIDADGALLRPGIVDGHVHIIGGGGEGGYSTRTPELAISDMVKGGVTTVIGLLGTDDVTRDESSLIAKTYAVRDEGLSAWCMAGSYQLPIETATGGVRRDIVLIEPVLGVGEVALSDHRSSQPAFREFLEIAAAARVGGMLSGKCGIVNVHMGDGKAGLEYLFRSAEETEIPMSQYVPTHMGRNPQLFEEGIRYAAMGGYVDFTTSTTKQFIEEGEEECGSALRKLTEAGVPASRISFSSDGQGSMPVFSDAGEYLGITIGRVTADQEAFSDCVKRFGIPIEDAVRVTSTTTADHYKLKGKGHIRSGADADILLLDPQTLAIKTVVAMGEIMMEDGVLLKKGKFE